MFIFLSQFGSVVSDLSINKLPVDVNILNDFGETFESYGLDISQYKVNFIKRRLDRRMRILDMKDYSEYALFLKKERKEFEEFFMSLSINVTDFFRDSVVYKNFKSFIIPKILDSIQGDKVRIWSAGCASGEEPYSIAISFMRSIDKFSNSSIEIIANDISGNALEHAQNGIYPAASIEKLPSDIISKYFQKAVTGEKTEYEIDASIKDLVTFKKCDILSLNVRQLDAIFCRNVLIYYERVAQELIMNKFYQSLKDSGYLVLGMDETMLGKKCEKLFYPLMARERIYQKISSNSNCHCDRASAP